MLEELHISGLGVIEDAWLRFAPGLNVLTGETGAGKTMVTVALGLALGARSTPRLVRAGPKGLWVEARFSLEADDPEVRTWGEGGELILTRTVSAEGRTAARVGGHLAPVSTLARLGERLLEFHGQHQTERLLSAVAQTAFLDRYAGVQHLDTLARYRARHSELRKASEHLTALVRSTRERERERDLLGYQVREIQAAGVTAGELERLSEGELRLAHAERILEVAAGAQALLDDERGAADLLREAREAVRAMARLDPRAGSIAARFDSLVAETEDVRQELSTYRDGVESDPARLQEVRERIATLRDLERKYGDGEEGILAFCRDALDRLASMGDEEARRKALEQEVRALEDESRRLAALISSARSRAAPLLSEALSAELSQLGMAGGRVDVGLVDLPELGPDGRDRAEAFFSGGAGQPRQALAKAASGGELSRTMLACRSVLADLDDIPTLVFDEVDAGIGGRTAVAVGRRLEAVASRRQVLVVTHLPQIAARADRQFLVSKEDGVAVVRPVEGEDRVAELARMLSGSTGEVSLAHARELMVEEGATVRTAIVDEESRTPATR